jgi:sporulation protein YlmC with PRC-barrel domain
MRFHDKDLRGIVVVTEGGETLGKLIGFIIDADLHAVVQYAVARSKLLSALLPDEILVHHSQVVSVDGERMVVKDEVAEAKADAKLRVREATGIPGAATRSEI